MLQPSDSVYNCSRLTRIVRLRSESDKMESESKIANLFYSAILRCLSVNSYFCSAFVPRLIIIYIGFCFLCWTLATNHGNVIPETNNGVETMLSLLLLISLTVWPFAIVGVFALVESYNNHKFRKNVSIAAMSKTYNIGV